MIENENEINELDSLATVSEKQGASTEQYKENIHMLSQRERTRYLLTAGRGCLDHGYRETLIPNRLMEDSNVVPIRGMATADHVM